MLCLVFFFLMGAAILVLMNSRLFDPFAPSKSAELAALVFAVGSTYGLYKVAVHFAARREHRTSSPKGVWK
jgi:hypothetical protein